MMCSSPNVIVSIPSLNGTRGCRSNGILFWILALAWMLASEARKFWDWSSILASDTKYCPSFVGEYPRAADSPAAWCANKTDQSVSIAI